MNKSRFLTLLAASLMIVSCGGPSGYLTESEIKDEIATYQDLGYTTYSYTGTMNFFGMDKDYDVDRSNREYTVAETSYYLALPTKLQAETFETDYTTILNKFTTSDSIDTVYCYKEDDGGLAFKVFKINKRLVIRRFGIECSAKWNAQIIYDENGYLVSENFATINSHKAPDTDSVYGECTYIYQE